MPNRQQKDVLPHLCRLIQTQLTADLSDRQLLELYLARRDAEAFAALVRRHGRTVLGVCQRVLNNAHDAEDAFQATFLVLVRNARAIARREAVGSWLYGVAYRVALKARAEAGRRRQHERRAAPPADHRPVDDRRLDEVRPILDEEVSRLPEKYRRPLVLCYFEGKTYAEAARLLGWPPGTASVRLARARQLLRTRLARRGLALSAAALAAGLADEAALAAPPLLADVTVRAALRFAADPRAAGVSAQVIALTKGVVEAMSMPKLNVLAAVLLAVGVTGGGAGVWCRVAGTAPAAAADAPVQAEGVQPPADLLATNQPGPTPAEAGTPPGRPPTGPVAFDGGTPANAGNVTPPGRPFSFPTPGGAGRVQTRIGLVNMARVIKGYQKFQAFQAEERSQAQVWQKKHDAQKAQLDRYQAAAGDPDATPRQREQAARQQRQLQRDIQNEAADAKGEMTRRHDELFIQIYRDVEETAQRLASANGLELVLFYNDAVTAADFYNPASLQRKMTQPGALMPLVVAPGMDITEMVLQALNLRAEALKGPRR